MRLADMTSRNGQVLSYDAMRRMISWQNTASNPTSTASYAYNGEGERVEQQTTSSGTTTTTTYVGAYEEIATTGSTTNTTQYYQAGGVTAVAVNGTLSYLMSDTLGNITEALSNTGSVQASDLYSPYGGVRYTNGTMPTSYGFTGQRLDPSGLMYFHARYYDSVVGQFACADPFQGPNRYGYGGGSPETMTDPTGKRYSAGNGGGRGIPPCDISSTCPPCIPGVTCNDSPIEGSCAGYQRCFILIDGPDIPGDPWSCLKCQDPAQGWQAWQQYLHDTYGNNIGFIWIAAPDANHGAGLYQLGTPYISK